MLCVGLIHGDLSEFNVLAMNGNMAPRIIDLPQAVDASANNNAEWITEARDVNNIRDCTRSLPLNWRPLSTLGKSVGTVWRVVLMLDSKLTGEVF